MFNTNFKSIEDCKKANNLNEVEIVNHLITFYKNQNYRNAYNKNKNAIVKMLKSDPEVMKKIESLSKKIAK